MVTVNVILRDGLVFFLLAVLVFFIRFPLFLVECVPDACWVAVSVESILKKQMAKWQKWIWATFHATCIKHKVVLFWSTQFVFQMSDYCRFCYRWFTWCRAAGPSPSLSYQTISTVQSLLEKWTVPVSLLWCKVDRSHFDILGSLKFRSILFISLPLSLPVLRLHLCRHWELSFRDIPWRGWHSTEVTAAGQQTQSLASWQILLQVK